MAPSTGDARVRKDADEREAFGSKDISLWGSFVLNFNNATGPALVCLPLCVQEAGWLFPLLLLWGVAISSGFIATMLCEAMQRIPGNQRLTKRYEYSTLVQHYMGDGWYWVTGAAYNVSLLATNVAAVVITAQVMDNCLHHVFGETYGVDYGTFPPQFVKSVSKSHGAAGTVEWPSSSENVLSLGFLIIAAIVIPVGAMNLDENMFLQWLSFGGLVIFTTDFIVQFIMNAASHSEDLTSLTPVYTSPQAQIPVVGVVLFANAYMVTIPSWLNEKAPGVSVQKSIWIPVAVSAVLSTVFAITGAWAYKLLDFQHGLHNKDRGSPREGADDVLNFLLGPTGDFFTYLSGYLWSLTVLVPGIPVLSIVVRYNLQTGGSSKGCSFLVASVAPVLVTAFLYERGILQGFCEWVAVFIQGYINFVIPPLLYRKAILKYGNPTVDEENIAILLPFSINVPIDGEDSAEDLDSAQSDTPYLQKFPEVTGAYHSVEGNRNSFSAFFQTIHFWTRRQFTALFTSGGKSIRIAHDSVRSLGGISTENGNRKASRKGFKPAQTSSSSGQLVSPSHWDPGEEPLLLDCNQSEDDGLDDDSANKEPEIHAVYPWMGMDKVFWANTLAVGLFILCTLAVLLTVYNSLDNALDDDDQNF